MDLLGWYSNTKLPEPLLRVLEDPLAVFELAAETEKQEKRRARRLQRRLRPEEVQELIMRYEDGESAKRLGARFGIHPTTVATHLKRNGVRVRRQKLTNEDIAELRKLRQQGWTYVALALKFEVNRETVRKLL